MIKTEKTCYAENSLEWPSATENLKEEVLLLSNREKKVP